MRACRCVSVILALAGAAPWASAGVCPSFSFGYSVWKATHIVVATEGEAIDGRLTVLESWKGGLKAGDGVVVPDLAAFADRASRQLPTWGKQDAPPRYVTGSRMVLFLVRSAGEEKADQPDAGKPTWLPASYGGRGGFRVSVAWVEEGRVYAFVQVVNPGPAVLTSQGSEEDMKARAARFCEIQAELDRAVERGDGERAAEAFRAFLGDRLHPASLEALASLGRSGEGALPVLRVLLADDALLPYHAKVVDALVAAGGAGVAPELHALVQQELAFWLLRARRIEAEEWRPDSREERRPLRYRFRKLLRAVRALGPLRYAHARDTVATLREQSLSNIALARMGTSSLIRACDAALQGLPADGRD